MDLINYKSAYIITNGKTDLFGELLHLFLEHSPEQLDKLKNAITSKNAHSIEYAAHDLKSSLISLGAEEPANICKQIESKGKKKVVDNLDDLLNTISIQLSDIYKVINSDIWKDKFNNQENSNGKV